MIIGRSINAVPIRLTDERWAHITSRHPELAPYRSIVIEAVVRPDMIQQGDSNELLAVLLSPRTEMRGKHVVVAYREVSANEGFVLTAYISRRPLTRRIVVWKR